MRFPPTSRQPLKPELQPWHSSSASAPTAEQDAPACWQLLALKTADYYESFDREHFDNGALH